MKNMDWRAREAAFLAKAPAATVTDVIAKLSTLLRVA
jgi:hypothetical protein